MRKYIKKTVEQDVVTDVICNCCGNSCKTEYDFEHVTIYTNFGYGSKHDGLCEVSHVCEDCYFKITDTFKIKPEDDL